MTFGGIVAGWDSYPKDTIGKQLVRATDSIGANLAEADDRYHFKERLNFYCFARGPLKEACYWVGRPKTRQLVICKQAEDLLGRLESMQRFLNSLISRRRQWFSQLREEPKAYVQP